MAQKRKRNKKWIYWLVVLVLFVLAGTVVYYVWDSYFRDKSEQSSEQRTEQVEEKKTEEIDEKEDGNVVEKKKVEQYDGEDPNMADDLSGVVTYAGVSGDKLMVRLNIDQYLDSGSCELVLEKDSSVVYNSVANVISNVSTATCEGFDVPISEIGTGHYVINVNVSAGEKSGIIRGEADI